MTYPSSINNMQGMHCTVTGRVQGVFYRANAQRKATELHITGWVRNLADGDVELAAFGTQEQLDALTQWLWQGPTAARVDNVDIKAIAFQEFTSFSVR